MACNDLSTVWLQTLVEEGWAEGRQWASTDPFINPRVQWLRGTPQPNPRAAGPSTPTPRPSPPRYPTADPAPQDFSTPAGSTAKHGTSRATRTDVGTPRTRQKNPVQVPYSHGGRDGLHLQGPVVDSIDLTGDSSSGLEAKAPGS